MKTKVLAAAVLAVTGVALAVSASVAADDAVSDRLKTAISVYTGSLHVLSFGEQVDCSQFAPAGQVLQTTLVFKALPGVCDDLSSRPCSGRLVAEIERCAGGGNVPLASNSLAGGYSTSPIRICLLSEAGSADGCANAAVVARGVWTGAGYAPATSSVLSGTASLVIRRARWFQFEDQWAQVAQAPSVQHFSQEKSVPGPASCGLTSAGCGVMGVGTY